MRIANGYAIEDGYVRLPDAPGIGLELKASLDPIRHQLVPELAA